jgi:probable rRNA maturation factor
MIRVAIADRQCTMRIDRRSLRRAVRTVLREEGVRAAEISLAVVEDAAIRQLHARYLHRDEPTDVLSFLLERSPAGLDGEIVVSGQTARRVAPKYRSTPARELLRYVIHGALHLAGWVDDTPRRRAAMRRREQECLARLGCGGGK